MPSSLDQALGLVEELQASLDQVRSQLAWSNRLGTLGTMAAGLAHEANNLLTPIGTYAQLALANPDNRELQDKALRIAVEGAAQAGRLTESMLGFVNPAGATAGACDVEQTLEQAVQWMLPLLERDHISVDIQANNDLAEIDGLALRQVAMNLISNARNALQQQEGPRRIVVAARRESDRVEITCEDNGPGVPKALHEHLFEPFGTTQAAAGQEHAEEPKGGAAGTGLGLSICKDLVESSGGTIGLCKSALGGAGFKISLKAAEGTQADAA